MNRIATVWVAAVCAGWASWASSARGQIFYEPITYQYGTGASTYYYGGSDPRVFDFVPANLRSQEYTSVVGSIPVTPQTHVYSDTRPLRDLTADNSIGYRGYTPNDARNEAYENAPRYFRKRDLIRAAVITEDGSRVVPAQAQPRMEIRVVRPFGVSAPPTTQKGTILVIPRKFLEKKMKVEERSVAVAQP